VNARVSGRRVSRASQGLLGPSSAIHADLRLRCRAKTSFRGSGVRYGLRSWRWASGLNPTRENPKNENLRSAPSNFNLVTCGLPAMRLMTQTSGQIPMLPDTHTPQHEADRPTQQCWDHGPEAEFCCDNENCRTGQSRGRAYVGLQDFWHLGQKKVSDRSAAHRGERPSSVATKPDSWYKRAFWVPATANSASPAASKPMSAGCGIRCTNG
jgi:hypothetical protein